MEPMTDTLSLLVELGGDENGVLCMRFSQNYKIHWRCLQKTNSGWWKDHLDEGSVIVSPMFVKNEKTICDECRRPL